MIITRKTKIKEYFINELSMKIKIRGVKNYNYNIAFCRTFYD